MGEARHAPAHDPSTRRMRDGSRARRARAAAIVVCLLTGGLVLSARTAIARDDHARAGSGLGRASISCHAPTYGSTPYVECVVESSGHIRVPEDVPVLEGNLSDTTPVTLTAVGGRGGADTPQVDRPGLGGQARTVVDYGALRQHGLYAYVGESGVSFKGGSHRFFGGSATMALSTPLHNNLSPRDIYLIAAGGGAQGHSTSSVLYTCAGGRGGSGGRADASHALFTQYAPGGDGTRGTRSSLCPSYHGTPGTGGNLGVGGRQPSDSRSDGRHGFGGRGGSACRGGGSSCGGYGWIGVDGGEAGSWLPGRGGETSAHAQGGGGYGGGGGGTRDSGAGAGGTYASAATASAPAATGYRSNSSLVIAFPQPEIDLHVAGLPGAIDYYVDGKLRETVSGSRTVHVPAGYVVAISDPRFLPNVGPALLARAGAGSRFAGWSGAATGSGVQVVTLSDSGLRFTAEFVPSGAIAAADGHGRVTVRRNGTLLCDHVRVCVAPHPAGEALRVTATPDASAEFSRFEGSCETTELRRCTGQVAAGAMVVATFKIPYVTLRLRVKPYGSPATLRIGGKPVCGHDVGQWTHCTVRVRERGRNVRVRASSAGSFDGWARACTGRSRSCTVDPSRGSQSLTATFG